MTQPQNISADQISYHCAVLSMKTSAVQEAQIRIIIYDNKNCALKQKTSSWLHYFNALHISASGYF